MNNVIDAKLEFLCNTIEDGSGKINRNGFKIDGNKFDSNDLNCWKEQQQPSQRSVHNKRIVHDRKKPDD